MTHFPLGRTINKWTRMLMIIGFISLICLVIQFTMSGSKRYITGFSQYIFQVQTTEYIKHTERNKTDTLDRFPRIFLRNKPTCFQRKIGQLALSEQDLPLTALASPWRSGNTWVRHLLQMATGIGTSAVYCDSELLRKGFPFECSHDQFSHTLVVKTHEQSIIIQENESNRTLPFERAVLVIRDPYNFLVGNIHDGHLDTATEDAYLRENTKWRRTQPWLLNWWNKFNDFWLREFEGPVYPLLYSNLLLDTETELKRLLDFLRVEYTHLDVKCVLENKEGNFHRKRTKWSKISDITELFDHTMRSEINKSVSVLSEILERKYAVSWLNESHSVQT